MRQGQTPKREIVNLEALHYFTHQQEIFPFSQGQGTPLPTPNPQPPTPPFSVFPGADRIISLNHNILDGEKLKIIALRADGKEHIINKFKIK